MGTDQNVRSSISEWSRKWVRIRFSSGQALQFDGGNDFIECGSIYNTISSTFTWEAWVNPNQTLSNNVSAERYALYPAQGSNGGTVTGMGVAVGTNGIHVVEHTDNYLQVQLAYDAPITTWTHIAVVYNNNVPALYVNGQFIKNGTASGKTPRPSTNLGGGYWGYFNGSIDEVRIWHTARSQAQLQGAYQQVLAGNETGLVSSWRFEEAGDVANNQVSGERQGSLRNGVLHTGGVSNGGSTTTYNWQALQGGSTIANPNGATTSVTVPATQGSFTYRVTLANGSCTTTQDVGITVTASGGGSGDCYVISNQQTGQFLQATAGNTVDHVGQASGQLNQVWRFESVSGGLRISNAAASDKVAYVDVFSNDQFVRLGADITGDPRYRWIKEAVGGGTSSRIRGGNVPWTQQYAGGGSALQIWGDVTSGPMASNPAYILYNFTPTTCPNSGGTSNQLAVSPVQVSWPSSASNQVITVTSNSAWSVSGLPSDNWLTATSTSGSGNGSFTLNGLANTTSNSRMVTLTVSSGTLTQTIAVNQDGVSGGSIIAGKCYGIENQQTHNYAQRQGDNTVILASRVANNNNQLWKAVAENSQFRFVSQANANEEVMYVNGLDCGQQLRVGTYVNDDLHRWTVEAKSSGIYRVQTQNKTWDQRGAGGEPQLQMCGNNNANDGYYNQPFRLFAFVEATCPNSGGTPNQLAVSPSQVFWPSSASSQVITVTSNSAWSVSGLPSDNWLTATSTSGSGNGSFTLNGLANTTSNSRTVTLTVSSGTLSQMITVNQDGTGNGSCNLVVTAFPTTINPGATSTLTVTGGGNAANYIWKKDNCQIGTGPSLIVIPNSTSTYQVECQTCTNCNPVQTTVTVASPNGIQPSYNLPATRYIGLVNHLGLGPKYNTFIDAGAAAGANLMEVVIGWSKIEKSSNNFDFSDLDTRLNYALNKGMKIAVRLQLTADNGVFPFPKEGLMKDNYGLVSGSNSPMFSINHTASVDLCVRFIQAVANHLNGWPPYRDNLIFLSLTNSEQNETNYLTRNVVQSNNLQTVHDVETDWSQASIDKYGQRMLAWGASAAPTAPPTPANSAPPTGYPFPDWKRWYLHRHQSLKEFLERTYLAAQSINSGWNLLCQFPNIEGDDAYKMGTFGMSDLVPAFVKGVKVNGDANANHNRIGNLMLRDRASDKWASQEVDMNQMNWSYASQIGQARGVFNADGSIVLLAQFTPPGTLDSLQENNAYIDRMVHLITTLKCEYPLGVNVARRPVAPDANVTLSLNVGLQNNWNQGVFSGAYNAKALVNGQDVNPVIVQFTNDILANNPPH